MSPSAIIESLVAAGRVEDYAAVAAIPGAAAGAGLSIALSTDLRVAAERALFVTAFANVGASGDFGMSWFLPRVVGEAKFLRGWAYFELVSQWGEVPLYTETVTSAIGFKGKSPVADIYAFIIKDLTEAAAALPAPRPASAAGPPAAAYWNCGPAPAARRTSAGWWKAPTRFLPCAVLMPVLPPTELSTCDKSVVGI